ncbi:MAG TPA: FKBP-type peptidyl-prolyl cis-trans isomerase [Candidatus Acidoferrum sp.]|nr:FKBP-type peptidyl-prolyl cis-trans isomerase [Candidatus Acidoferrum sp.]
MKKIILTLVCIATAAPLWADGTLQLTDEKSRVSYAIGMMLGQNFFKRNGLDTNAVDVDIAAQAIKAVQSGATPLLSDVEMQQIIKSFQKEFAAKQAALHEQEAIKNKADGAAFLAANKKNDGVITLPDGLQYMVITNGSGPIPTPNDKVSVNYRGTLIDGTEFDNSYKRGQPAEFPVTAVIHGWTEALEKMTVGSKWKLFIPSDLAYGERGRPGIPPNSVLIFDIELLDTKATPPPSAPPATQPLTSDIIKVPSAAEMKNGAKIEVIKPQDVPAAAANQSTAH